MRFWERLYFQWAEYTGCMSEEQNGHGMSRLDLIERALELFIADHEQFREEHKRLLTAQVLLGDRMDILAQTMQELARSQKELAEQQMHTDARMNGLIAVVDGLVRNPPNDSTTN